MIKARIDPVDNYAMRAEFACAMAPAMLEYGLA